MPDWMRSFKQTKQDLQDFFIFLKKYFLLRGYQRFAAFEKGKDAIVDVLYMKRGKYSRPFLHAGMMSLLFVGMTFGPVVLNEVDVEASFEDQAKTAGEVVLSLNEASQALTTQQGKEVAEYRGGEIIEHEVRDGETVSSIAQLYNLQDNTIIWLNGLNEKKPVIKPGQRLRILPVDGVLHKVKKGETIFSIAKKYGLEDAQAQGVVNYPFNSFLDNETFALAVGQDLVIPDGVIVRQDLPPSATIARTLTPNAGSVSAAGSFVWPASGTITQGYRFYHKAIDIANRVAGNILAADSGTVVVAGWPDNSGYGNRVMIDHGNGYITLYAHLSLIQVQVGQTVNRGDVIGQMGSTGRSTGTHLHFEIRNSGVLEDPQAYLK